ncbi:TetR family transcriptional regulator [Streptomyces diastaticus]|uniref:TetR family transcriptional regulator n=1 Tax=Streptomyces diastaticus TaxID=1956 RepID=UPI00344BC1AE
MGVLRQATGVVRRGRVSAGLDRERIADAAVALADRDGLEVFGVRRLAQELGVDPMSIHHHVKGKAALLDAMSEAVLAEVATVPDGDGPSDWEEVARRTAHEYRAMAYRHPRIFPLLVTGPDLTRGRLRAGETGHRHAGGRPARPDGRGRASGAVRLPRRAPAGAHHRGARCDARLRRHRLPGHGRPRPRS